ncbi:hypothetical protein AVEN_130296-1 [Araneus ventricosus]|uniref:Uncharacterized protein n=1 Tax=Araneus ventricosus TaxID=182803 RepID=A0A4Y2GIE3_ARAVE|nr:hypothetical protein AVEN_130296-1 [Araneus ventricosus]
MWHMKRYSSSNQWRSDEKSKRRAVQMPGHHADQTLVRLYRIVTNVVKHGEGRRSVIPRAPLTLAELMAKNRMLRTSLTSGGDCVEKGGGRKFVDI